MRPSTRASSGLSCGPSPSRASCSSADERVVDEAELVAAHARAVAERRARQPLGRSRACARAPPRAGTSRARCASCRRGSARVGEREQQVAAARRVGALLQPVGLQRALEVLGGLLVGEQRQRPLAGADGVVDRLLEVAGGRRDEVVVRELGDVRLGVGAVELLERGADRAMQDAAALRPDVVVERLADRARARST